MDGDDSCGDDGSQPSSRADLTLASRTSSRRPPSKASRKQAVLPPKSSALTRGISLFARKRAGDVSDTNSVISEISQDTRSVQVSNKNTLLEADDNLKLHLEQSGLVLLKRLIEFLSECPPAPGESTCERDSAVSNRKKRQRGLTLPASAAGWIANQLDFIVQSQCASSSSSVHDFGRVPKQQLECLQSLLKRVSSLKVNGEVWPPPHSSDSKTATTRKGVANRIRSRFAADIMDDDNSVDDDSCSTALEDPEQALSPFQRYYHELRNNPDVDMSLFPNATKIVVNGVPPNWILNLDKLRNLETFQIEKGCIVDVNRVFFSSDLSNEDEEGEAPGGLFRHESITKLRLSNCAISEAAGLRGKRDKKSRIRKPPTMSRFPNLVSLNLANNELFKTKTAFAGLASLPMLSSIDLSHNRLRSLDNVFTYIGNVTELILTGNEITSTRGLDRLFSLEKLCIDDNRISLLSNLAGISSLPFLANLDATGNPLEEDDPTSFRIKVFNLFREVRCKNMAQNATFRDMQRLLPILDGELATKDEMVALKEFTFRQTVVPDSLPYLVGQQQVDASSEVSVNMPDQSGSIRKVTRSSPGRDARISSTSRGASRKRPKRVVRRGKQVKFGMPEVIATVRPRVVDGDTHEDESEPASSRPSIAVGAASPCSFSYQLPQDILDEADDQVWNGPSQLDLIPTADDLVWDTKLDDADIDRLYPLEGCAQHEDPAGECAAPEEADESAEDGGPIQFDAVFGEVWEQTYQEVVTKNDDSSVFGPVEPPRIAFVEPEDFNQAEEEDTYDGPPDYFSLAVESALDLYFDSFVFRRESAGNGPDGPVESPVLTAPRIQLFKFDRSVLIDGRLDAFAPLDLGEQFVGALRMGVIPCGAYARGRLSPARVPRRGFHGDRVASRGGKDVLVSEARELILCLSDGALYFIVDDDNGAAPDGADGATARRFPSRIPPGSSFGDAAWPHALTRHPLDCLRGMTIGFQFQRLVLRFAVKNPGSDSSVDCTYVLVTSDRRRTVSLLRMVQSRLPSAPTGETVEERAPIDNDDRLFLDLLGASRTSEDVLHYQILHQVWKRGERGAARRAFVLSDSKVYLLDETYAGSEEEDGPQPAGGRSGDVSLSVIDSAGLGRVTEVRAADEDPRRITLVILPSSRVMRSHRWRLVCADGDGAERLVDDVRRALAAFQAGA